MYTVGLDLANTSGIAWSTGKSNIIQTKEIVGSPIEQIISILQILPNNNEVQVGFEDFVYFGRNPKIASILIRRLGYTYYRLLEAEYTHLHLLNLQSVRAKYFKGKDKKQQCLSFFNDTYSISLTDNHTDAILMVCYQLDLDINDVRIRVKEMK